MRRFSRARPREKNKLPSGENDINAAFRYLSRTFAYLLATFSYRKTALSANFEPISTRSKRLAVFGKSEQGLESADDYDILALRTVERGELIENRVRILARVRDETKAHPD